MYINLYKTYIFRTVNNQGGVRMAKLTFRRHKLAALICTAALLLPASVQAKRLTILYVPLDNRPVCSTYVQQTMEAANCKIILPPEKYIASNEKNGNPDGIWEWLEHKAPKADAAVISTDSLIYGGLVASRTHNISHDELQKRVKHLYELKTTLPIKLYAFSTIMRTPRASKGRVEPPYYSSIGPSIFAYSQLLDKQDQGKLSPAEKLTMQALERNMKKAELGDWLERREKNLLVNQELTRMARNGKFHYFAIGKDDNATLSATHMEGRKISLSTFDMSRDSFQILDGVDQLGLLLIARAYNEASGSKPSVYPLYSVGAGASTLPQYSDARLQDSVPQQIIAAGAVQAQSADNADLILALNTPQDGIVKDSTADDNQPFASVANKNFVGLIGKQLQSGHSVSLADISYSNGADNGFMQLLSTSGELEHLTAYNGWNTGDNAVGYAIAQGLIARDMSSEARNMLLRQRLIDDWFYQSNARRSVSNELEKHNREDLKYDLATEEKVILQQVTADCQRMVNDCPLTKGTKFSLSFPWKRLFEVEVKIKK